MQNKYHSFQPSCQYGSFLSTHTVGLEHKPSPQKGEVNTRDTCISILYQAT